MPVTHIGQVAFCDLQGWQSDDGDICTLEVTVPTGMEDVSAAEVLERLNAKALVSVGRAFFDVPVHRVPEVLRLRSVENVRVVLHMTKEIGFTSDRTECFQTLYGLVVRPSWRKGVRVLDTVNPSLAQPFAVDIPLTQSHEEPNPLLDLRLMKDGSPVALNLPQDIQELRKCNKYLEGKNRENDINEWEQSNDGVKRKKVEITDDAINSAEVTLNQSNTSQTKSNEENTSLSCSDLKLESDNKSIEANSTEDATSTKDSPSFRVTCSRSGTKHVFGSPEGARQFGAAINDRFGWRVDLVHSDIDVILDITTQVAVVGIALTREPLFRRNLVAFGPTNLRATLCYALVHLARPQPGEVLLDHMCGGAGIPIEGSLAYPSCFFLGGEIDERAVTRAQSNLDHHRLTPTAGTVAVDCAMWDATRLPLRTACVDAVVSDLPFGRRCGSKTDNKVLYFHTLQEIARVTRPSCGRAVLLTHDKNSMIKNLSRVQKYWRQSRIRNINIGGLSAVVFQLSRTSALYTHPTVSNASATKDPAQTVGS